MSEPKTKKTRLAIMCNDLVTLEENADGTEVTVLKSVNIFDLLHINEKLVEALRTSMVRLEICMGRFAGCEDGEHLVSLAELPAWIKEMKSQIAEAEKMI